MKITFDPQDMADVSAVGMVLQALHRAKFGAFSGGEPPGPHDPTMPEPPAAGDVEPNYAAGSPSFPEPADGVSPPPGSAAAQIREMAAHSGPDTTYAQAEQTRGMAGHSGSDVAVRPSEQRQAAQPQGEAAIIEQFRNAGKATERLNVADGSAVKRGDYVDVLDDTGAFVEDVASVEYTRRGVALVRTESNRLVEMTAKRLRKSSGRTEQSQAPETPPGPGVAGAPSMPEPVPAAAPAPHPGDWRSSLRARAESDYYAAANGDSAAQKRVDGVNEVLRKHNAPFAKLPNDAEGELREILFGSPSPEGSAPAMPPW